MARPHVPPVPLPPSCAAETLIDKAVSLPCVGGTFGGARMPTDFLCLVLKMLQIQPEMEIVLEFIKNMDFKYVRALGAFYLRLTGRAADVYTYLEPLLNDFRKIRMRASDGSYKLMHMDEFIESLLDADTNYACDITLPHLLKRHLLEARGDLDGPRTSVLQDELDGLIADEAAEREKAEAEAKKRKEEAKAREKKERTKAPGAPPPPPPPRPGSHFAARHSAEGRGPRDADRLGAPMPRSRGRDEDGAGGWGGSAERELGGRGSREDGRRREYL